MPQNWIDLLQVGTNLSLLLAAASLVRKNSRMELKVDTMWAIFMRKFGSRNGEEDVH